MGYIRASQLHGSLLGDLHSNGYSKLGSILGYIRKWKGILSPIMENDMETGVYSGVMGL